MKFEIGLQLSGMVKTARAVLLVVVIFVLAVVIVSMFRPAREFTPASAPAHNSYFPTLV
jgi:hypothetical protein